MSRIIAAELPVAAAEDVGSLAAPLLSVIIPCLNEAENIEQCVTAALRSMELAGIDGEVIVADNDSEDGSAELAELAGAHVVHEPLP
jgi:glycosyltransferase involved in cell wall biosynthesis